MPKKIAIISDVIEDQSAGVHVYLKSIITELKKSTNFEYIFIHLGRSPFFKGTNHHIIPDYPALPGWTTFRKFMLIPLLLRRLKVDAVWEPAHFGPFNLPKKIKRITTIHDLTPILFPHQHTKMATTLHKLFFKRILKKADLLLAVSNHTAQDLANYYPPAQSKTTVIPLATKLQPSQTKPPKQPYFLFVGTIEPRKNLQTLIKAYNQFRQQHPQPYQLIIVGQKGWQFEPVLAQIKKSSFKNDIVLTGHIPRNQLINYYEQATALIYPSLYEGFGLPVLEAMTLGSPCLIAETSSLPEVGSNAVLYFDPKSDQELTHQMLKLVQSPKLQDQLSQAGQKQAAKFSWSNHIKQLENALSQTINLSR